MSKKDFFKQQKDGTAVKIKFYQDYLENYLIKVLMQFGVCLVADLFCGPGKSGNVKGSPLVLIDQAKKVLQNPILNKQYSSPKIYVFLNDINKSYINILKSELSKISDIPNNLVILEPESKNFSDILNDIEILKDKKMPKFFFLDPFSYSKIKLNDVNKLMNLTFSEILLFLPVSFAYRFHNPKDRIAPKLKEFLENFTSKGICKYKDIHEFINSIKEKLKKDLNLDFVRPIPIDVGKTKSTLFFLTKNIKGMFLANNIFFKESYDGKSLNVDEIKKNNICQSLFKKSQLETKQFKEEVNLFQCMLVDKLKKQKMKNTEIIKYTAMEGFPLKYANDILKKLKDQIVIDYLTKDKTRSFYVSEENWDKNLCILGIKML